MITNHVIHSAYILSVLFDPLIRESTVYAFIFRLAYIAFITSDVVDLSYQYSESRGTKDIYISEEYSFIY